jgi:mannose-6-phosphate isomerase
MEWYPLKLTYHVRAYAFGERMIPEMLGKAGVPDGVVAETWEFSCHDETTGSILNGALAGQSLHDVTTAHPIEVVGEGWSGTHFPLLGKFIDASHPLPVHLHADDEAAARIYGAPNGKTEAWHILWAAPGATILAGVNEGATPEELKAAFRAQDFDRVMPRHPIRSGDTVYVPGGILHAFGPDTLVFEIQQTSDLGQHVMPTDLYGNRMSAVEWATGIERVLAELRTDYLPRPHAGLKITREGNTYTIGAAGPHFVLERWHLGNAHFESGSNGRCLTLTNVGDPVAIRYHGGEEPLARAESCILPAAIGDVVIEPTADAGADLLVCYIPDLTRDVISRCMAQGYERDQIYALGIAAGR